MGQIIITEAEVSDELLRLHQKGDDPGQTMIEIAEKLGRPVRTVRDIITRALRQGTIRIERGSRSAEDLMGRMTRFPVYRIYMVKPAKPIKAVKTKRKSKK